MLSIPGALLPSRELSIVSTSDSVISMSCNVLVLVDNADSLTGVVISEDVPLCWRCTDGFCCCEYEQN